MKKELTIKKEIIMSVENYKRCKRIAKELEKIVNNNMYEYDGEIYTEKEIECDADIDIDDCEPYGLYDYFLDVYDIRYTIGSDRKTLYGVQLLVAFGGPNIYIDTNDGKVKLFWWNEYAEYELSEKVIENINELFEELYFC